MFGRERTAPAGAGRLSLPPGLDGRAGRVRVTGRPRADRPRGGRAHRCARQALRAHKPAAGGGRGAPGRRRRPDPSRRGSGSKERSAPATVRNTPWGARQRRAHGSAAARNLCRGGQGRTLRAEAHGSAASGPTPRRGRAGTPLRAAALRAHKPAAGGGRGAPGRRRRPDPSRRGSGSKERSAPANARNPMQSTAAKSARFGGGRGPSAAAGLGGRHPSGRQVGDGGRGEGRASTPQASGRPWRRSVQARYRRRAGPPAARPARRPLTTEASEPATGNEQAPGAKARST